MQERVAILKRGMILTVGLALILGAGAGVGVGVGVSAGAGVGDISPGGTVESHPGTHSQTIAATTNNTTTTRDTTVTVRLDAAPNGLQAFNVSVAGPSENSITTVSAGVISGGSFQIVSGGEGDSTVTARAADLNRTVGESSEPLTLYEAEFNGTVNRSELTVTVTELRNDDGSDMNEVLLTLDVTQPQTQTNPFPNGIGSNNSSPPTDTDDDGKFEDINGDGESTFDDAIALTFVDTGGFNPQQRAAVDFDGDGDVDFDDAIELAFQT
jgi:hypothetical protein